jgi:glycosyltransferase involved in cell wall biosynthesis
MTRRLRVLTIGHSHVVRLNRRLAAALAAQGWEVAAVAPQFMHGDLRPIPFEPDHDHSYTAHPVPAYGTRSLHTFLYGRTVRHLLRDRWDIIHVWEEPFVLAGAQIAHWIPRSTPFVFVSYQNLEKRYPPPFRWTERYALGRAAGWVTGSQTVTDVLRNKPLYAAKPHALIPLGVDPVAFHPDAEAGKTVRRELGWDGDGPPVVGYLGRFVPEKGIALIVQALNNLKVPWRVLFVGGGPLEADLQAFANKFPDRVRIANAVPHDRVPAYLNAMDLLVAPSQTTPVWKEQLGRMLIEAFACGVPVVASDSGEIPHVVADAGIILPESNIAAWTETLGRLLTDAVERSRLGEAGLERCRQYYFWESVARQYDTFFRKILDSRKQN